MCLRQVLKSVPQLSRSRRLQIRRNRTFGILTDFADTYPQELRVSCETATEEPFSICPIPYDHVKNREKSPMCLACPTCWSAQRVPGTPRKHNTRTHRRLRKHYLSGSQSKRGLPKHMHKASPRLSALSPVQTMDESPCVSPKTEVRSPIKSISKGMKLNTLGSRSSYTNNCNTRPRRQKSSKSTANCSTPSPLRRERFMLLRKHVARPARHSTE